MLTLAAFVFTLLLLVLCIWVYKKRPAEAAGNSMAFSAAGEVIKVLLVSSAALGMGIVFISLVESGRDGWFVFGLIFGLLLFYAVVQMIYYMDIKKLWKGKWQLLCSAALVGIVALVCRLDLLGYDTYLPKQDSIKNINIISNGGFIEDSGYWDGDESSLNRIEMGCDDSLYQNVREIIAASEKYWADYKQSSREDTESTITFAMKYEKKNGQCGYRIYTVYFKDVADVMKQLCNRSEYLDNLYPIRTAAAEDVQSMEILTKHAYGEEVYSEKDKARFRLVEALKKDMENLDGETIEKEIPLARISYGLYRPDDDTDITPLTLELQNLGENYMYGYEYYYCYVYPSFVNTIAVLKEAGYDLTEKTTAADVKKIRITNTENDFYENVDYTDEAEIEELLDALVFSPLATEWYDYEDSCTAQVFWKDGGAEEDSSYWLLRTDKLPEFLKEQT